MNVQRLTATVLTVIVLTVIVLTELPSPR